MTFVRVDFAQRDATVGVYEWHDGRERHRNQGALQGDDEVGLNLV